jgi:hypothetical protein
MNYKTTLVLLALVAAGAAVRWLAPDFSWLRLAPTQPSATDAGTLRTLQSELTPEELNRMEVQHGQRLVVLERGAGDEWTLPGKWPARKAEVEELVRLLTNLRSRFVPIPLHDPADLKGYGLDQPPVLVTVRAGMTSNRLAFGEEPGESNRFSRPTYLRLDDRPEVVRLAPGLITLLDRPQDYYQQRRLFPSERVAQDTNSQEKVDRLLAQSIAAKGPTGNYRLDKDGEEWKLQEPVVDHVDPDKLKTVLSAVPDIWAEQFVDKPKKDLAEYGLKEAERTLRVTRPTGTITLLIGKPSQTKARTVTRPAPNFGGPPLPPQREVIHEEYRFAKLQDNDQLFEIKSDKLKDVLVSADSLRDANLVRFRSDDARRLEISHSGEDIVLVKTQDKWTLQKPLQADADSSKVTELLDKLASLQARDKDVIDHADAKSYGLDKPAAVIQLTVEEDSKSDRAGKMKKSKHFALNLGKQDADHAKLYVQVAGRERINAVEDSVLKLVQRPALAYRGRRVLDFNTTDLAKIEVHHGSEPFTLEQVKGTWRLAAPVQAEVDRFKAGQLAGDLARLEAVEYITESAAPDRLEPLYGLGKPSLSAQLAFTDAKKPTQTLLIGKQRESKPEYFAKLESATPIFIIKKDIHDALEQDSLAYRPPQLWHLQADEIKELRVRKEVQKGDGTSRITGPVPFLNPEYQLKRDGQLWKITGPFEATALADLARSMAEELANLRCERYAAHDAKEPATYGLDKPYLRLTLPAKPKEGSQEAAKEESLLIGKPVKQDAKARFAKLGDKPGVFILGEKTLTALDHGALDLLDRNLLTLSPSTIERIQSKGAAGPLTLERKGDEWQVTDAPAAPFPADRQTVTALLEVWSNLRAVRFAAYGPKVNLADYGLDEPSATIIVTQKAPAEKEQNAKPIEHTLTLGKAADPLTLPSPPPKGGEGRVRGGTGERFARLDDRPGILVLAAPVVGELEHSYLDFVNRTMLHFDASQLTSLRRDMGSESFEILKRDGVWQFLKPANQPADAPTLGELAGQLAALRAKRVAAYPAKELSPFQLDKPVATLTIRLARTGGKPEEHLLKIGKVVERDARSKGATTTDADGDRFAVVGNATAVFVLPGALVRQLTAPALQFRDRNLARLGDADRIILERDRRKAVFAKVDGTWKMTEPLQAEAEQTDLEEFAQTVARLRADELVAERPTELKPYGLERPLARWHFQTGDKEVVNLLIGGREQLKNGGKEKDGPRCYAKLASSDLIFLLSPQLTAKVEGEYRTRTLWAPLDAAQIEKLTYGYADRPFILEKVDNDWRVAAKPDVKVRPEVIRETLDTLAGLKAARYVVDKDAELKLYGLEPPQLVLEIQTRTGNRALHVGRPEGESKRSYARVPEAGNSAVFIISEDNAGRIIKPLAAFVQEPHPHPAATGH